MYGTEYFDIVSCIYYRDEKKFFKVQCKETKQLYIMEVVPNNGMMIFKENQSNSRLHSSSTSSGKLSFFMELKFFFATKLNCYYVLDYPGETNLSALIKEDHGFTENMVLFVGAELAVAINDLHDCGLTYCELTLNNIKVDCNGHVVLWREFVQKWYWDANECVCSLAGLNCGKPLHKVKRQGEDKVNGERFFDCRAEEMKNDWRALGVALYAMVTGDCFEDLSSFQETTFPDHVTANTKGFIKELLEGKLWSFEQVECHPSFSNVDWNKIKTKSVPSPLMAGPSWSTSSPASTYFSKYPSLQRNYATETFERHKPVILPSKSKLARTYSASDLHSYSPDTNRMSLNAPERHSATTRKPLLSNNNGNQNNSTANRLSTATNYEVSSPRSGTCKVDHYSSVTAKNGRFLLPSYSSAPPSPRRSISATGGLFSSTLSQFLDTSASRKSDNNLRREHSLPLSVNQSSPCLGLIHRSQSSQNLVSLASTPAPQVTCNEPERKSPWSRSVSYSNLSEASRHLRTGTERSERPEAVERVVDSKREATPFGRRCFAWSPIPSFEEFRAMRALKKLTSDETMMKENDNNNCLSHSSSSNNYNNPNNNYNNNNHHNEDNNNNDSSSSSGGSENNSNFGFSGEQANVKTRPSSCSNAVIQELLVKYGLNKTNNVPERLGKDSSGVLGLGKAFEVERTLTAPVERPSEDSNRSRTTTAFVHSPDQNSAMNLTVSKTKKSDRTRTKQSDLTSTKERLLSMVDDFLDSRNKVRTLTTSVSMSEIRNHKPLSERRTVSSPRIGLFEERRLNESSRCSEDIASNVSGGYEKEDPYYALMNGRISRSKVVEDRCLESQTSSKTSSCLDLSEKELAKMDRDVVLADALVRARGSTDNEELLAKEIAGCHSKVTHHKKRNEDERLDSTRDWNNTSLIKERTSVYPDQQVDVSCADWNTKKVPNQTSESTTHGELVTREHSTGIGKNANDNQCTKQRKRSSSVVKKPSRKHKRRGRSFSVESRSSRKEDFGNAETEHQEILSNSSTSSTNVNRSQKSKTSEQRSSQKETGTSRAINDKNRGPTPQKRASTAMDKSGSRMENKDRGKFFIQKSQSITNEVCHNVDAGKLRSSLARRTSSLLSLTDDMTYMTVHDEYHDNDIQEEDTENINTRSSGRIVNRDGSRRERLSSGGNGFLSVAGDTDHSRTESNSSLISRGSSFLSNISTDSGSLHLDFVDSDDDGDVFPDEPRVFQSEFEIKRNDSGLGDEIGVTPRLKKRWEDIVDGSSRQWSVVAASARYWREMTAKKKERRLQEQKCVEDRKITQERKISRERQLNSVNCPDCGRSFLVDKEKPSVFSDGPSRSLICYKCQNNRVERKEAIIELVQTEINYGNDFQILKEEFLSPMQTGGIVSPENLVKIFLNIQELLDISTKFCKKIETSMEECIGKNDEEFCHMQIGKIFVENVEFFQAYELYCCKQPEAVSLLESLQKKNEVLRVFLNITCRENPKCRKMDINSFLLAPVQRVMKYPLLLNRIRRATPRWHGDREDLKLAQRKLEEQITKINSLTKSSEVKTKKFHSNLGSPDSVDSSRLKKLACDVLNWTMDEIQLLMQGVLKVTCCEFGGLQGWTKRGVKKNIETHLLFCIRGQNEPITVDSDDEENLLFPHSSEVSDATLLLLKRKNNGKYTLFRDEIKLRNCVVYEEESDAFGVIHMGKETFVFTARTTRDARRWLKHLRLQTKDQGKWRRRRNASANIMLKT